ncbi:hypothetical protein FRC02_009174 [Tulasnella sp. 418]|nr:hypothetical protein FRC02_009174 [Tulasnella sp. 418]
MKGITKAIMRTPHMMTSKVGMSKTSSDPEFDNYNRAYTSLEGATEKLLKDTKAFTDAVVSLLSSGNQFAVHFASIFTPGANEFNIESKFPEAMATFRHATPYQQEMDELRATLSPELELIESRIVGPIKELQSIMKLIRKNITKRDHKLLDYDRYNNSLVKLREKKEKTLNDEKNLFKLEQDFERSVNEYETFNNALKADLPRFLTLATQFIDPLFHSFYYMQLNIFYLMMEKLQGFAEKKYTTGSTSEDVVAEYHEKRGDTLDRLEALQITHRIVSTGKFLQTRTPSGGTGLSRSSTSVSNSSHAAPPPSRANTVSSKISANNDFGGTTKYGSLASRKGAAPPPPQPYSAAPPPYVAGDSPASRSAASLAAKKAPPPPPPVKPKPAPKPAVVYVTALYDFEAQAEGDLSFRVGDKIELIERSDSAEDWWTGKLNGQQGVFPGNYVQA